MNNYRALFESVQNSLLKGYDFFIAWPIYEKHHVQNIDLHFTINFSKSLRIVVYPSVIVVLMRYYYSFY